MATHSWTRTGGAALGLTTVLLFWFAAPLISPKHQAVYHWNGSGLSLFLPVLFDWLIAWGLLTTLFRSAGKPGFWRATVWLGSLGLLPFLLLKSWSYYTLRIPPHTLSRALFYAGLACAVILLLLWRFGPRRRMERLIRHTSTLLLLLGFSGVLVLLQLIWFGAAASAIGARPPRPSPASTAALDPDPAHRVIWLVFDELSYQQVFAQRFPGLSLPAFDALAAQATVFTHTRPAGYLTERILPALMTGKPVDNMLPTARGFPSLHDPVTGAWSPLNPQDTVFADARKDGDRTAAVGWFNPYCRILGSVLDQCTWSLSALLQNGLVHPASLTRNMLFPIRLLVDSNAMQHILSRVSPAQPPAELEADLHEHDLAALTQGSDAALRDPANGFVFLHLPVPHPPGIYDRHLHRFSDRPGASYLDNLALADLCLAHIRDVLQQKGQWDASTIVLMGDHGWRIPMWRGQAPWTPEEERASNSGIFDDRPVYLVKLPGQHTAATVNQPFAAERTRALFDIALRNGFANPAALVAWATQPGH